MRNLHFRGKTTELSVNKIPIVDMDNKIGTILKVKKIYKTNQTMKIRKEVSESHT